MVERAERDQAIHKIVGLIRDIRVAMLTTLTEDGRLWSRPVTTLSAGPDGELWFMTRRDSPKVQDLYRHRRVSLNYVRAEDNTYLCVSGVTDVVSDRRKAEELWDPSYRQWFPGGPGDPGLALLRVRAERAEYWDAPALTWPSEAGFVVLAPEQREDPEFHARVTWTRTDTAAP